MLTALHIAKEKPSEPTLNYEYLRAEGLKYIKQLSRKIWTDYNIHDPGITILELLCYAITDLGYRTSYPLQDILAEVEYTLTQQSFLKLSKEEIPEDLINSLKPLENQRFTTEEQFLSTLKETIGATQTEDYKALILKHAWIRQFFSAAEILPSKPVTLNDYRKLLIDIEGVNNAWLEKADVSYFVDCLNSCLSHRKPSRKTPSKQIHLQGLYNIILELEEEVDPEDEGQTDEILDRVKKTFHQNRNLCEDFLDIKILKQQHFVLCAEIEVEADTDVLMTQVSIFHEVQKYLTPSVPFHTLQEMFDKGKTADRIFEGPRLDHGFIDDDELEQVCLRDTIRLSDIIRIIMGIKGVKAVKDIVFNLAGQELPSENKWIIEVSKGYQPILDLQGSRIVYYKDIYPFTINTTAQKEKVAELRKAFREQEKESGRVTRSEDIPVPGGEFRNIQYYYSFQNHFPRTYGIGETGLPEPATTERKAQAKQLKAYLLFYDQVLANYFAQLSHVKELFALDDTIAQTYFTQVVFGLKGITELYGDFENLQTNLQNLAETQEQFFTRRNRFLDHLLARFAENFHEYVWMLYSTYEAQAQEEVTTAKLNFLKEYSRINCARGAAFNYMDTDNLWDTGNVSGLARRVARLLGISDYTRRNLAAIKAEIYQEEDTDSIDEYRFRVIDRAQDKILLSSSTKYSDKDDAFKEMEKALTLAKDENSYEVKSTTDDRFYFNIVDSTGEVIARNIEYFESLEACEQARQELIDFLQNYDEYAEEGLFVVEHILLRPQNSSEPFLPICIRPDCSDCENADPYSFRVSIILPAWTKKFADIDFRRFAEKTIRMETPAHILPRICWVSQAQMSMFEEKYKRWLERHASSDDANSEDELNEFFDILNTLKNVYREAMLSECSDESHPPFILDKTILGTQE